MVSVSINEDEDHLNLLVVAQVASEAVCVVTSSFQLVSVCTSILKHSVVAWHLDIERFSV